MTELNTFEMAAVSGGTGDIFSELEERFPGGVWYNGSFYPNGLPDMTDPLRGTEPW
ncbi:hypothetical protein [Qipengyuania flava]|uniref:hypothetical protein n=1 Tax=Qipengyuania flava TaxID=192812 RepID=UPI001C630A24|nr:hypothetical protein [Qipengyuania flava]QYJ06508.1 hypothetical protein KUV82_10565 [Qipengyuania flava]